MVSEIQTVCTPLAVAAVFSPSAASEAMLRKNKASGSRITFQPTMLYLAGCAAGLIAGLMAGGSLRNLAAVRLRWPLVVIAALLVKEAGVYTPLANLPFTPWLFAVSLAALLAWAAWHARELPAM